MFRTKRVYEKPSSTDGLRVLVDRLWPRGVAKDRAKVDLWLKELAPSGALRKWFAHDPERWPDFQRRYRQELREHAEMLKDLKRQGRNQTVTLLFSARDQEHNNAVALKRVLSSGR